jgi:hypothetical protein
MWTLGLDLVRKLRLSGFTSTIGVALTVLPATMSATSIVAERTPQKVVVAADSKAFHVAYGTSGTECKILLRHGIGFAESGIPSYKATGFDSKFIAKRALLTKGGLTSKERLFETLTVPALRKVGEALFVHAHDLYAEAKGAPLEVFFFGIENGAPTLIEARFRFDDHGGTVTTQVYRRTCPGECGANTELRFLGFRSAINQAYASDPSIVRGEPERVTANLVQLEIDKEGIHVGPPISVLSIDGSGPHWINRGACQSSSIGTK